MLFSSSWKGGILDSPTGKKKTIHTVRSAAGKEPSVGSCHRASISIEQNGNKCILRNPPAKGWPRTEFFFIFSEFVARMNLKCKMKYLSTIKNRYVGPRCLCSMCLSSQRIEGRFRRALGPPCLSKASFRGRRSEMLTCRFKGAFLGNVTSDSSKNQIQGTYHLYSRTVNYFSLVK